MNEEIYTRDPASVLEERKLLQQIVALGVGYPYCKSWGSNAAISDSGTLHGVVLRMENIQKSLDTASITQEDERRIRMGEGGYYLIDLYNGYILSRGKHPIDDIIIDFTLLDTDDHILLRKRKGTHINNMAFLISPKGVFFVGTNRACIPFREFHMISFVGSGDNSKSGFVVDYDAAQNDRPLVLFPCEENNDIIQTQLDQDDRCRKEEYKSFLGDIGFDW